jgi:cobalt transporter subunit CbtA
MFRRIFVAALGAGIGVGVLIAALQHVALVPMLLEAEKYEKGSATPNHEHGALSAPSSLEVASLLVTAANAHDHEAEAPMVAAEGSPWRPVFTWIATTLTSVGFALLLAGAYAVSGRAVDAREGLLWGIAGFAAFALAPAFGLPPELPGSVAADLFARQAWWIGTAVATAAAIWLMLFVRASWVIPVGVALLVAPHVIGAPKPPAGAGLVPPELAAAFAARSLGVNAAFWALLGLATGALYARFGRAAET